MYIILLDRPVSTSDEFQENPLNRFQYHQTDISVNHLV